MRDGFLGSTVAVIGTALLVFLALMLIGSMGSSPVFGPNGITWDHTGRIAWEQNYTARDANRQREQTAREVAKQAGETKRAEDANNTVRWLIVALTAGGAIWIVSRETGATVRNRDDNKTKVAMYQIYMRQQYPNARIEVHNHQQLVVDPDSQTVFPLAVLRAEARAAGYDEM